jgi:hypothetical protein
MLKVRNFEDMLAEELKDPAFRKEESRDDGEIYI